MNNLVTTQVLGNSYQLKSLAEQRFKSPAIKNIDEKDLLPFLVKAISEVFFKCGVQTDAQNLKAVSMAFKQELYFYPWLTIEEIKTSFNRGYKEHYGKYYGLNVKTFISWVEFYIKNERQDELNRNKVKKEVKHEISDEEKKQLINSAMQKCIKHYEENRTILDGYIPFMYDVLIDDGYMSINSEEKNKAYKDATDFLKMNLNYKNPTYDERLENKKLIEELKKPKSPTAILKAKEMLVSKCLRELFKNEELINKLKKNYGIVS